MKKVLAQAFVRWIPLAVASSGIFVFAYWAVQQEYRLSLNDPQVQMAEDGAAALNGGAAPASLVTRGVPPVDIAASLAPWIAVYDASGTPLESSAELDGAPPRLPAGVFDTKTWRPSAALGVPVATPAGETFFTWQPRDGVRQAVVLAAVGNGLPAHAGEFVAAGRNMREVEARVQTLTSGAALAWGITELATFLVVLVLSF